MTFSSKTAKFSIKGWGRVEATFDGEIIVARVLTDKLAAAVQQHQLSDARMMARDRLKEQIRETCWAALAPSRTVDVVIEAL